MRIRIRKCLLALALLLELLPAGAETNRVAAPSEIARNACVADRRHICGRVLQVLPEGLVVDSGYVDLLGPLFNQSWLVRGTASLTRDPAMVEENQPDAIAVGLVFLTNVPKRPSVKVYDYVSIRGYPSGRQTYRLVPGVEKTLRRFSASLDRAVKISLAADHGAAPAH